MWEHLAEELSQSGHFRLSRILKWLAKQEVMIETLCARKASTGAHA
jgi:hypothetical protein